MQKSPPSRITWATEKDVGQVLEFIRELAVYERLASDVIATEETLRACLFGARKYAEVLFIEENSERVGFALFFHNFSTFMAKPGLYLEDLYVRESHRGRGYGKRLLSALARIARERGCGRMEWSVLDWNKPSIDFYISLGSKPMNEWTVHRVSGDALDRLAEVCTE